MAEALNPRSTSATSAGASPRCSGGFAFLDAPGGSQVPDEVGDAIARALREASANLGAGYETSLRVKEILETAEADAARFLGCDAQEITFGANMTSLDFTLRRTAGRDFAPGDEILVSSLDHDGGVAPWLELAADRDLVVKHIELHPDTTLDYDDLARQAVPGAPGWSRSPGPRTPIGTVVDAARVCRMAHDAGALAWIDAVHYAAHEPIDVRAIDADVLICSPYKFCGPHLGMAYGSAEVTSRLAPVQGAPGADRPARPAVRHRHAAPTSCSPGFNATIDYLDSIGGFEAIVPYERALGERFLAAISDAVTVYGLPTMEGRVPTFLVNVDGVPAADVAASWPSRTSASGPTTPGTRWTSTSGSATSRTRSGSASSTTTPRKRSTGWWRGWRARGV